MAEEKKKEAAAEAGAEEPKIDPKEVAKEKAMHPWEHFKQNHPSFKKNFNNRANRNNTHRSSGRGS